MAQASQAARSGSSVSIECNIFKTAPAKLHNTFGSLRHGMPRLQGLPCRGIRSLGIIFRNN